jgi:hypothetical protein
VGDDVDPKPRGFALAYAAIEQVDVIRHLRKQRIERVVQYFQPRDLGIAQVNDHARTISGLDAGLAERIA